MAAGQPCERQECNRSAGILLAFFRAVAANKIAGKMPALRMTDCHSGNDSIVGTVLPKMPTKKRKSKSARTKGAAPASHAKASKPSSRTKPSAKAASKTSVKSVKVAATQDKGPKRSLTRVKIGEAMRVLGLDESKLAGKFDRLLDRLEENHRPRASEKLLLEVLRECGKLLEAYPVARSSTASAGAGPNVPVQLVTMVPRPERETEVAPSPSDLPGNAPAGAIQP
jgi:hypothetical protein